MSKRISGELIKHVPHESLNIIAEGEDEFVCDEYSKLVLPKYRTTVWNYFGHPADSNGKILTSRIAICIFCNIKLRTRSTTAIRQHLEKHHSKEFSLNIQLDSLKNLKFPVEKLAHKDMHLFRAEILNSLKFDKILTLEKIRQHPIYSFFGYAGDSDGNVLSYEIIFCTICQKGLINGTSLSNVTRHLRNLHVSKYKIYLEMVKKDSKIIKLKRTERIDKITKNINKSSKDLLQTVNKPLFRDFSDLEYDNIIISNTTHLIWKYFGFPGDKNKNIVTDKCVICIFCNAIYHRQSVQCMKKHLNTAHVKLLKKSLNQIRELAETPIVIVNPVVLRNYRTLKLQSMNYTQILTIDMHKQHNILKHFGFPGDSKGNFVSKDVIICKICNRMFFSAYKPSNLLKHLQRAHSAIFREIMDLKEQLIEIENASNSDNSTDLNESNEIENEMQEEGFMNLSCCKILKPKLTNKNSLWNWFGFPGDNDSNIITTDTILCTICFESISFSKKLRNICAYKHLEEIHNIKCENKVKKADVSTLENIQKMNQMKYAKILKPKIADSNPNSIWKWFGFPGTEHSQIINKNMIICSYCYEIFKYINGSRPSEAIKHLEIFHKINSINSENIKRKSCSLKLKYYDESDSDFNDFDNLDHTFKIENTSETDTSDLDSILTKRKRNSPNCILDIEENVDDSINSDENCDISYSIISKPNSNYVINLDTKMLDFTKIILQKCNENNLWKYFGYKSNNEKYLLTEKLVVCIFCYNQFDPIDISIMEQHLLVHKPKNFIFQYIIQKSVIPIILIEKDVLENFRDTNLTPTEFDQIITLEKKKKSPIYKYFGYPANDNKIITYLKIACIDCKQLYSFRTTSSTLIAHYSTKHKQCFLENISEELSKYREMLKKPHTLIKFNTEESLKFPKLDTVAEINNFEKKLRENVTLKEEYTHYLKSEWRKIKYSLIGFDIIKAVMSDALAFKLHSMEFLNVQSHNISFYNFIGNYSSLYNCISVSADMPQIKLDPYVRTSFTRARRRYVQRRNKTEKNLITENK